MSPGSFTEEDAKKYQEAINFVTAELQGKTGWDTTKCLEWIRHLSFLQKECGNKIMANIAEVVKVHEAPKPEPKAKSRSRSKASK